MSTLLTRARHHEEYPPEFDSAVALDAETVAPDHRYIGDSEHPTDLLALHDGKGKNLYLVWNDVPKKARSVDVVVHLHGYYWEPNQKTLEANVHDSGLDLSQRKRPTLGIIPRGRKITKTEYDAAVAAWEAKGKKGNKPNDGQYRFPALTNGDRSGFGALIKHSLDYFCTDVLGGRTTRLRIDRLIITAHSGGVAALNLLLASHAKHRECNPDEVHVFDGTYGTPSGLIAWLEAHITPGSTAAAAGKALRVTYVANSGTSGGASDVETTLTKHGFTRDTHRVESWPTNDSNANHYRQARAFGPILLGNASASLPHPAAPTTSMKEPKSTKKAPAKAKSLAVLDRPPIHERRSIALQVAPLDWCQLRTDIARIARAEEGRWIRPNGTKAVESDAAMRPVLEEYWRTVPHINPVTAAQQSANNVVGFEWSAAFICFVMSSAGVRRDHGFEFSRRHLNYIVGALRNREGSDMTRPFWLTDHIEIQAEAVPEPGDILCFNRTCPPSNNMTTHTYHSLQRAFGDPSTTVTGCSHCSIVLGTVQNANGTFLETIGGNETQSVRLRSGQIALNASGGVANPGAHDMFGMIKLVGCQ